MTFKKNVDKEDESCCALAVARVTINNSDAPLDKGVRDTNASVQFDLVDCERYEQIT